MTGADGGPSTQARAHDVRPAALLCRPVSAFHVVPAALDAPARADARAAEMFSGAADALRRHSVDTGRGDSGDAVALVVRTLAAEADVLADAANADADALRGAAGGYLLTDRRAIGR